jgi:hypothetical protein
MKIITLSILTVLSMSAFASPPVQIGQIASGGSGCPAGSINQDLTDDGIAYTFNYVAEAGNQTGKRIDRKSCMIAIPVRVAQGYQVSLVTVVSGFVAANAGSQVRLNHEQFFAGARGPALAKAFTSTQQEFRLINATSASKMAWSACGADTIARLNTSVLAQANSRLDQTVGGIGEIRLQFVARRCQ